MSISNQDDNIAGSDVVAEIERLNEEIEALQDDLVNASDNGEPIADIEEELDDLREELRPLVELEEDITYFSLGDVQLISDSAFEEYAMRFAIDCGEVSEDSSVFAHIDWDGYARDMKVDYTSVTFDGEEYLYHS